MVRKELGSSWKKWLSSFYCALILFGTCFSLQAQSKKFDKAYDKAQTALQRKDFSAAKKEFLKCLSLDTTQVKVYLGLTLVAEAQKDSAQLLSYFNSAFILEPTAAIAPYSQLLWNNQSYQHLEVVLKGISKKDFSRLSPKTKKRLLKYQRDLDFRKNNKLENNHATNVLLDTTINSKRDEYRPSFSIRQDYILFTRLIDGQEDFYISYKIDSVWTTAVPLDELNTRYNEGAHSITADGKTIIFTACEYPQGLGSCDLYISRKAGKKWSKPQNMGFPLNTRHWESQPFLAPDNRTLYFSSNRPGGQGGKDIWKSVYKGRDGWSKPEPLPDWINTNGDEQSPFIYYDNSHLFFTSDVHPGFGGIDVFYSRGQGENWMLPVNAGPAVNSVYDEQSLHIESDGQTALMSRDVEGNKQLFELFMNLPDPLPKSHYSLVQVKDAMDSLPISAAVVSIENNTNRRKVRTDRNGQKLVILPQGADYTVFIEKEGYTFTSTPMALTSGTFDLPDTSTYYLYPIKEVHATAGKEIILNTVEFATGSAELRETSVPELQKLYAFLIEYPDMHIQIEGHTDDIGDEESNLRLSENRAKRVQEYLLELGIGLDRVKYIGKGESEPIASNAHEEGRQQNRRTSFRIITP